MNFANLETEFAQLRRSLRTFVGEEALNEISVQIPSSDDEASFLRLIAWSYVFVFEAGRVTVPYLIKLRSRMSQPTVELKATCDLIHDLRTWSFHNLSFSDERELAISKRTARWFIENAGTYPPDSPDGWRRCFTCLCQEVHTLLLHCRSAVEVVLTDHEDDTAVIEDLRRRLDRNWPAHRFDELVRDTVTRIGQELNVPHFRQSKLARWREFLLTIPASDDPQSLIVRLIERDVLDHFESILPIDGNDVMAALGLDPGPEVRVALGKARHLYDTGVTEPDKLLAALQQEWLPGNLD